MSLRSEERDEDDPFEKANPADFPTLGPEEERAKSVLPVVDDDEDSLLRALLTPLAAMFLQLLCFALQRLRATFLGFYDGVGLGLSSGRVGSGRV